MPHSTPLKPPVSGFIKIGSEVSTGTRCFAVITTDACDWPNMSSVEAAGLTYYFYLRRVSLKKEVDLYRCVHVMTLLQVIASSSRVHCKMHEQL